jgi:hypothetical protein
MSPNFRFWHARDCSELKAEHELRRSPGLSRTFADPEMDGETHQSTAGRSGSIVSKRCWDWAGSGSGPGHPARRLTRNSWQRFTRWGDRRDGKGGVCGDNNADEKGGSVDLRRVFDAVGGNARTAGQRILGMGEADTRSSQWISSRAQRHNFVLRHLEPLEQLEDLRMDFATTGQGSGSGSRRCWNW